MNERTLKKFRKWFLKNVPVEFSFDDPHELLKLIREADEALRKPWLRKDTELGAFLFELVSEFEVAHVRPEELGPIMIDASVQCLLRQ